jgi:hypothetical protein
MILQMQRTIANIISVLFHPMFMPTYGILILFNSGTYLSYIPFEYKRLIFIIILVNTAIIPISLVPFYLYRKIIGNIHMESTRERVIPLLVNSILFYFAYYLLSKLNIPSLIKSYILAGAVTVFIALLISFKWKISIHMIGIGGLLGAILVISFRLVADLKLFWMALIIVAGLTGFARLRLCSHNPVQVYIGFIAGFVSVAGVLLIT